MIKFFAALWAAWTILALNVAMAQGTLTGLVRNEAGTPATAALVTVRQGSDSTVLQSSFADSAGRFSFGPLKDGSYRVTVEAPGYATYQSPPLQLAGKDAVLDPITLRANTQKLKEVAVAARKPLIVQRPDRVIVNVEAMLTAAGGTALDVLQRSPGVQVDANGLLSLKGKGAVMVYIDDKPSYLSGEDLANYLRSMPASSLDQVELMTNPPAQYDAAGTGGVINLRIKRSRARGRNGALNLGLVAGRRSGSNNSANINYRNSKISAFANASYSFVNNFTDLDLNRVYRTAGGVPVTFFEQNSYFRRQGHLGTLYTGADYSVSDKTTLGVVLSARYRESSQQNDNTSNVLGADRVRDSVIVADNRDDIFFKNGSANLSYRTRFDDKGHAFTADADYLTYINRTEQAYYNNSYGADYALKSRDTLTGHLPSRIDIYSVKADYTRPTRLLGQLAAGGKYSVVRTDNLADYRTVAGGLSRPDYAKSNQFLYGERIGALYLNADRRLGNLSVQAGLRYEHTATTGHQLGNVKQPDSLVTRDYSSFFPTLYLSYKFDTASRHQLGLSYGRRIERPYYEDLNPFLYPMDKFTYYTGNPFLKPAFMQTLELSHTYKDKITTTLAYSRSRDDVNETIEINNGIYYSRPGNIGRKTYLTVSVNAVLEPAKWLHLTAYTEVTNIDSRSDFYNGPLHTNGSFWFINGTARAAAGKGWDVEISGDYRTRVFDAQFITGAFWQANGAVQKKVSNALTLKLALNDLFYTRIIRGTITNLVNADAGWVNRSNSQTAVLTLSYRFGQAFNNANRHEADGADAEKRRVKN